MTTAQKENPPVLSHVATDSTDRQAFALLKWQAGKIQQELVKVPSGYLLSRWGQTRHCSTLSELQTILARMGVKNNE
ncbi:hypothetical protein [Propionivibrio sp.]|uniref:hypothetical protein n=1 Tax=Propionivibrio sp. TaxID=2212460 RepID=UPI003BF3D50A